MKEGFEPPTLGLWFQSSNQLNYFILFQLHVPVQLPCYDFIQITNFLMIKFFIYSHMNTSIEQIKKN